MNLFEAFNIEEPEVVSPTEKAKKEKKANANKNHSASKNSTPISKVEEINVDHNTLIRYGGDNLPIGIYFTDEEIEEGITVEKDDKVTKRNINSEDIRSRMEHGTIQVDKDELVDQGLAHVGAYPELVSALTVMHVEKEKNMVIPVIQARKKGCGESSTDSSLPKIPFSILIEFCKVARYYATTKKVEVHGDVYWNPVLKNYEIHFPEQRVHKVWAEVKENDPLYVADRRLIMQVHSHHFMAPLPSSTDDRSEVAPNVLYAIVGDMKNERMNQNGVVELGSLFPSLYLRMYHNGQHITLNPWQFIEHPFDMDIDMPQVEVISYE
ncbi:Mov34/MPN/PAD-1 family protein [Desertibacillus haloalkaliphilus]|uniref:Mov34/MPN/PAD-1 family protein n=1 Tax=Desertibacillus haloalkaliphilus TaxID=1328930 RepID=UPI001C252751|nr:Mov34/MPN/PAD-1 family protein [Desertibacillus haloalkaliphilus]MBU8908079.1 Mov34/MPN/PAD-1 family protein [Desertibacillus haloalkaliphilus]